MERAEITLSGWFRDKNRLVYGIVFLVLAILLLIDLVPLFRISAYNIPCADDYRYGTLTYKAWESTGSVIEVMKAAVTQVKTSYYSWQGTFSAIFLMALQPAVFGEQFYWVGTLIMLLSLSIGTIYFCFVLFTGVCGFDKYISGIIGTVVTLLCIELVPYPSQAFYWYNGSIFYTFYHGVFLFAVGLGIRTVQKGGWWRLALLCLLAAFIGGGNYVTGLTAAVVGVLSIGFLVCKKNCRWKKIAVPVAIFLASFCVSIIAPGNAVRQTYFERLGVVEAVLSSFHYGFTYILEFKSWPLVGALVLWGVIFWYSAPKIKVKVKYPWIVSVLSYCVFSAMFCPTSYAMNSEGEGRTVNIYFYAYILFAVINCLVWVVWLRSIYDRRKGGSQNERGQGFSMVVLALVCFAISYFPYDTISDSARYSLSSGEAQQYWACGQERLVILKDSSIKDAELDSYPVKPYLLYFVDITEDKDNWKNTDCAGYYEKDSVVLKG